MPLLALWAFALLIALGEAKDKGKATEGSSQGLPGNLNVYLEANDAGCTRELYQPKYQLPLPREYNGLYKSMLIIKKDFTFTVFPLLECQGILFLNHLPE